ncbi:MAG TPA: BatA domain-containing protein [Verrucomicrobiota bacterium]|nr:BatA domain-containing protein [Verrucomicrobiota bacterium]
MTFLQPLILWGLPLVLLPVIIHLINRMRHRPRQWAAMQFLLAATRSSTSHAKLRNLLIMLMRIFAVLTLLLFLARPLVGGWMGWALAAAPDVILLLVDRSASMDSRVAGANESRREYALRMLADAAEEFEHASHLVLLDSATRQASEIPSASSLLKWPDTQPTDTAADLPAMLQTALDWLIENQAGTAELWIASDLQASNWKPDDPRWGTIVTAFDSLPQKVRVRLLAATQESPGNASIAVAQLSRQQASGGGEVRLAADLKRSQAAAGTATVIRTLNGVATELEVSVTGQSTRWRHRFAVGAQAGGWGKLELPADGNPRDNITYYRYSDEHSPAALVVTESTLGPLWQAAASVAGQLGRTPATRHAPADVTPADLRNATLVVWQAPLPEGEMALAMRRFADEGGRVVFFPPGQAATARFAGLGWGEKQTGGDAGFVVGRWDEDQGPLANTDEGLLLPLAKLGVRQRQQVVGQAAVLAAFDDGQALLVRQALGQGEVYFCATLPLLAWSEMGDGLVVVPMLQRLLAAGSRRLQRDSVAECGQIGAGDLQLEWTSVETGQRGDVQTQAGVYQAGDRWLVVNRPAAEDEFKRVEDSAVAGLFGTLSFQQYSAGAVWAKRDDTALQGEIWRLFLFLMLIALLVEAWLIRPGPMADAAPLKPQPAAA